MDKHERHAMRRSSANVVRSTPELRTGEHASARIIVLVLVFFLLGIAAGAFLIYRGASSGTANAGREAGSEQLVVLSDSTKAVLERLDSPVEIRFYSLLDPASVPDSSQAFARRVDQLLSAYQREAAGKINVVRYNSLSDANAGAASADGIKPFNMDKGDACYLGITIAHGGQKESLPQLFPEWEQALEFDLARAIVRVSNTTATTKPVVADTSQPDKAVVEEVKRAIPNLASVSLEEGKGILRGAAMNEFSAAAEEMQKQVKDAQQRLAQAQSNSSEAVQQAAMKQLQQVQAEQTEKLKQIAARAQAQIQALEQIKRK
jgi:ABC-type uncharacterized transport system